MRLSAQQFREIIGSLRLGREEALTQERRRAARAEYAGRATVTIVPERDDGPAPRVDVEVRNFSPRGIAVVLEENLGVGRQLIVELPREGQMPILILGTVIHCERLGDGAFEVGAEFTCGLDAGRQPGAESAERRRLQQSILS